MQGQLAKTTRDYDHLLDTFGPNNEKTVEAKENMNILSAKVKELALAMIRSTLQISDAEIYPLSDKNTFEMSEKIFMTCEDALKRKI